jgi:hypothetical protein
LAGSKRRNRKIITNFASMEREDEIFALLNPDE